MSPSRYRFVHPATPSNEKLRQVLSVEAKAITWLAVYGNLWLAMRHPANTGASTKLVRQTLDGLSRLLIEAGVITPEHAAAEELALRNALALRERSSH